MDSLEHRIRAARPISGHRELPLSDRAKRELGELVLSSSAKTKMPRRTRKRRAIVRAGAAAALAGVTVVGVVTATGILSASQAHAATPPLLTVVPLSIHSQDWLGDMSDVVATTSPLVAGNVTIDVQTWTLHLEPDEDSLTSAVVPENHVITRATDGSVTRTVTAGAAIDHEGAPAAGDDVPADGTLLWEETWEPGEYTLVFSGPLPEDPEQISAAMSGAAGSSARLSAAAAIEMTTQLLLEQTLTPRQSAGLLQYFASLPDLTLAGRVIDRGGRSGLLFTADDRTRPEYPRHLIVSDDGHILATETLYTGTDRTDIPSPSVINYYLWR